MGIQGELTPSATTGHDRACQNDMRNSSGAERSLLQTAATPPRQNVWLGKAVSR